MIPGSESRLLVDDFYSLRKKVKIQEKKEEKTKARNALKVVFRIYFFVVTKSVTEKVSGNKEKKIIFVCPEPPLERVAVMKEVSFLSFYSPLAVGGRSQYLVTRNVGVGTQWL